MKKASFLIFMYVVCSLQLTAQVFTPSADKLYQSFIGDVHLLTLFVDTEDDYWDEDEMEYYKDELIKSQLWLTHQASNYGQELTFKNEHFRESNELIYMQRINRGYPQQLIQQAMDELSFRDIDDFFTSYRFDFANEKFKILLLVKNNSRSHAYNLWSKKDVDVAIVFCQSSYGIRTDQFVISHELLHQFGAWDLYFGESQSKIKAQKALDLFPNSIMINTHSNKENLAVDSLTSWLIGWHTDFEEKYNDFIPVREKRK